MTCFITGATGFLGGAVAARLAAEGHTVRALARSDASASVLRERGYAVVRGSLDDPAVLRQAAQEADAVLHFAVGSQGAVGERDLEAARAMLDGLEGRGVPFLLTSGLAVFWGEAAGVVDEAHAPQDPVPWQQPRLNLERLVIEAADRGVRTVVLRPAHVYGHAQAGAFTRMQLSRALEHGAALVHDEGATPFPTVHIDDLADAYLAALDRAPAGRLYHLVGHTPSALEVAQAVAQATGNPGRVEHVDDDTLRDAWGRLADLLVRFPMVGSLQAVHELGWRPRGPSLAHELLWGTLRP